MTNKEALRRIDEALKQGKTELELTHLKLEQLPEEMFALENLEIVILHNNCLRTLPKQLWSLKRLKRIFLDFNQLAALPEEVATLPDLQVLGLNGNRLSALPPGLWQTNIKELFLAENPLKRLPPDIGHLASLEKLYLGDTQLRALPKEIGNLKKLKALHVPSNRLSALPKEIAELKALEVLNLSGNRLSILIEEISELSRLRTLNLTKNPLPNGLIEASKQGMESFREALGRHVLPGIRLRVSGETVLHELRGCLSAVEHLFNSYLVFESLVSEAAKQLRSGSDQYTESLSWPITPEGISARVRDPKRIFVRNAAWGLEATIELATRSTKTAALMHLVRTVKRHTGQKVDAGIENALSKKRADINRKGLPKALMDRLTSELIDTPARALQPFLDRGILRDAELLNCPHLVHEMG
jgi:Leucine-rich repeat (LRR) protein